MDLKDIKNLFDYTEWANDLAMDAANKLRRQKPKRGRFGQLSRVGIWPS
jgi:hypothetical protein